MDPRYQKPHDERADELPPVEVPVELLSHETLLAVLESFIVREGTDYGLKELAHDTKIENLKRRLAHKHAHLIFDPNTESITFMTDSEWRRASEVLRRSVETPKD